MMKIMRLSVIVVPSSDLTTSVGYQAILKITMKLRTLVISKANFIAKHHKLLLSMMA